MTLIEKMARAIREEDCPGTWERLSGKVGEQVKNRCRAQGRAALSVVLDALREPSGQLLLAIDRATRGKPDVDLPIDALRALADHLSEEK